VADEEAFFVVVGADEPAGDTFVTIGYGFLRYWGWNTSTPLTLRDIQLNAVALE